MMYWLNSIKLTGKRYVVKTVATNFSNTVPVFFLNEVLGQKFASHTHTEHAGLEPFLYAVFGGRNTSGHHNLGPRTGSYKILDKSGTVNFAGKNFCYVATAFLGFAYFADGSAPGAIRNQTAVADNGDVGIK